jgi:hypothetical protein
MIRSNDRRCIAGVCLGLILVTLAIYWPARLCGFVQYDDPEYVTENQTVQDGLSRWGLQWAIVDAHAANWHPITWLSHMLDCQLFGLDAGAHHLVNVLLHCTNSALLFLVLRAMTGAFWRCAFVAALFAWHPLRVESVAWISERKDVLSGFFFMLTLWAYARYAACRRQEGGKGLMFNVRYFSILHSPSSRFYCLALAWFALGLLSKPMLVTLPCILLLMDIWPLNRWDPVSQVPLHLWVRPGPNMAAASLRCEAPRFVVPTCLLREKIPFFLLSLAAGLLTFVAQKSSGAMNAAATLGIAERIGNLLAGYFACLEKLVWPRDLAVIYLRPASPPVLPLVCGALIVAAFSAIAAATLRRRPYLTVGWFWFVVMLLPVSGVIPVGLQLMADRYTYLPGIGLGLVLAWGAADLAATLRFGRTSWYLATAATGTLLVACAAGTRDQLAYWKDTETLMGRALEIDPNNYIAHENLGVYYLKLGRTEAARAHRQRACELDPARRQTRPAEAVPRTRAE